MSKRNDVHKVLIIGSGPIIIGQACEFDYSGTQACKALRQLGYEIVLVNDGSTDNTLGVLRKLAKKDSSIHFISFSRNFGKEAALYAGLEKAKGQFIAVMDADLQDPPSLLPEMLDAIQKEGYDCAATCRTTRKNEPVIRSFFPGLSTCSFC